MRFRLTAFLLHLTGSTVALATVLGAFWLGWYRWPGWYLASVLHVAGILVVVDLVLGPTLTLIVASPTKPRRVLARDIAIIVTVQLAALVYGATTLWLGRPLYYTFSSDRLELVQGSDLKADDIATARRDNPSLAPFWSSRPRWIWAPMPQDPEEAARIVNGALLGGGADIIQLPRYFRPWQQGLSELHQRLHKLEELKEFSPAEKRLLKTRMARLRLSVDQPDTMVMWGGSRRVLVVFDLPTLRVQAIVAPD
jgi:hypothetical protein